MSKFFVPGYGSITQEDSWVIEATLLALLPNNPIRFLEIGCYKMGNGFGVNKFLSDRNCKLVYWGVDAGLITRPQRFFPWATSIHGKSEDVCKDIPDGWDLILLDGCHCKKHVMLDINNYSPKVAPGGFLLLHDCSPIAQGKDLQPCGTGTDVLGAMKEMGWPTSNWRLFMEKFNPGLPFGGMRSYQKI